jgi:parallel beta-helix repeat protein
MTTLYVRKDGNDTTGNGSTETPWLTIHKGITTASAGDTLLIGDGTYAEDSGSGYFFITKAVASVLTIRSESGNADLVTITGASVTTYDTLLASAGTSNLTFEDLTWAMRTNATANGAIRISRGNGIIFNRCKFIATAGASARYGCYVVDAGGVTITNITFNACTFTSTGGGTSAQGILVTKGAGTTSNITFNNCIGSAVSNSLNLDAGTNIVVSGGTFANAGSLPAVTFGKDADSNTNTITGSIANATVTSVGSHGLIIGAGCSNVTVTNCTTSGGDYGIVVKECAGAVITGCIVTGGSAGGVYHKAATGSTLTQSTIRSAAGSCVIVAKSASSGHLSGTNTVTYNHLYGTGTAGLLNWGDDTHDSGGGICDYNTYHPDGSAKFGAVRADADVQTLAELRAAWADYDQTANDSHSSLPDDGSSFVIMMARRR